jgi:hypothetical protein
MRRVLCQAPFVQALSRWIPCCFTCALVKATGCEALAVDAAGVEGRGTRHGHPLQVLSKRKLITLVTGGHVAGWDDPRRVRRHPDGIHAMRVLRRAMQPS